jgi:hypothetical protein
VLSASWKNPFPSIAKSRVFPVLEREPWVKLVCTSFKNTPSPTWVVLDPPPSEAETRSANDAWLDLNPTVPTFAMLFPITDMALPYVLSPLTAEKSEVKIPMVRLLYSM